MKHWIVVGFAIMALLLHQKLSTTKFWFLGGALPFAGIAAMLYQLLFAKTHFSSELVISYIVFFISTILIWIIGRYEHRQKELKRMKANDIS